VKLFGLSITPFAFFLLLVVIATALVVSGVYLIAGLAISLIVCGGFLFAVAGIILMGIRASV